MKLSYDNEYGERRYIDAKIQTKHSGGDFRSPIIISENGNLLFVRDIFNIGVPYEIVSASKWEASVLTEIAAQDFLEHSEEDTEDAPEFKIGNITLYKIVEGGGWRHEKVHVSDLK